METATLTKAEESQIDRMSEGFAQPSMEERFKGWASRVVSEANKRESEEKRNHAPREAKGSSAEERAFIEAVGEKADFGTESPRESTARTEQRSDAKAGEKATGEPGTPSAGQLSGDRHWTTKLEGKELETFANQVRTRAQIAHSFVGQHPQRAQIEQGLQKLFAGAPQVFRDHFYTALAEVSNPGSVLRHLALKGEDRDVLRSVKNWQELRAAIHAVSQGSPNSGHEQAMAEAHTRMSEMVSRATAKYPDAAARISTATNEVLTKAPAFVQHFVNDSKFIGDLLYTLADHTTLTNLLETARTNPDKALRVLRGMELDIQQALSRSSATKPRAPRPPSEVGGRGYSPDDGPRGESNFSGFDRKQRALYAR